jgi:lysophospholipase L1-like esterase
MKTQTLMALLAISLLLNLAGAFAVYKALRYRQAISQYQDWLQAAEGKARDAEAKLLAGNPYRAENARLIQAAAGGKGPEVIFYGASITRNWDLAASFPGENFVNRGMGGKLLPYLTLHFRENVIDLHPRFVVIKTCGINMTPELPPETVRHSFMNLCQLAEASGITPIVATMLPAREEAETLFPGYSVKRNIHQFNEWAAAYARERSYPLVDYYQALADEKGFLPASLSRDALHPSAEGYRVMTEAFQSAWQAVGTGRTVGISKEENSR